ncbi:MAG: hypothetical protein AB8H80_09060 [Planctomycetota bacterium]
MRSKVSICVAAWLCLSLALHAQSTVPATMQGVEGGGGTNIPFGSNLACRYQLVYDKEELSWTGPRFITGMRIRPDFAGGGAVPAKGFLEVSILMSTTSRNSATSSAVFADNYGVDATWVVRNRVLQLPAQPATTVSPRPATIDFPFTDPWVFGLTPVITGVPAPENLLVEIQILTQPSGSYRVDNLSSCTAAYADFGNVGPACSVPTLPPIELTGGPSMQAGSTYTWEIDNALPSMPFFLSLNIDNQGGMLGNPAFAVPYPMFDLQNPLLPSALLAPFGRSAPDCWFNIDPGAQLGGVCDSSGHGVITAALPAGREYVGTTFYAQAVVLAPTSNPLFLITSRGRETTVCGPLGVSRVYQFYNTNQIPVPPPPASGARSLGVGMVLEFY